MSITINGKIVTDLNLLNILREAQRQRFGNDGNTDFTTEEIQNIFAVNGLSNIPLSTWRKYMGSHLGQHPTTVYATAYDYLQKHYPTVLGKNRPCTAEVCTPSSPPDVTVHKKIEHHNKGALYLYQPFPSLEYYLLVDRRGELQGTYEHKIGSEYSGITLRNQDNRDVLALNFDTLNTLCGWEGGGNCWQVKDLNRPKEIPLSKNPRVHYSVEVPGRLSNFFRLLHNSVTNENGMAKIRFNAGTPLYHPQITLNGTILPRRETTPTKYDEKDKNNLGGHQQIPAKYIKPGVSTVVFKAEDLFGREYSHVFKVYFDKSTMGETTFAVYGKKPKTQFEKEFEKETRKLVEEYQRAFPGSLQEVRIYRSHGDIGHAVGRRIAISPCYNSGNWKAKLRQVFAHEVYGHVHFLDLPVKTVEALDKRYLKLLKMTPNSQSNLVPKSKVLMNKRDIELKSGDTFSMSEFNRKLGIRHLYKYKKSAIWFLKESHYLKGYSKAGHPWNNTTELYASVVSILRGGKREALVANLRENLQGEVLLLALEVVEIVQKSLK